VPIIKTLAEDETRAMHRRRWRRNMKSGICVLTALLALICAGNAAAQRGGSIAHSGVAMGAPHASVGRPAFVARPAFVSQSFATHSFVGHPFVGHPHVGRPFTHTHAPFPRTRIIVAPVLYFPPPPLYYAPPPAYYAPPAYADPNYYAQPSYPSDSYYAPPAASDPQYQPPVAQAPQSPDYLYFCPDTRQYYPAVAECASGWLKVVPDSGTIR
jgi:hypothetical protein